jgi:NADH-quinone oxidoreductase subunit E
MNSLLEKYGDEIARIVNKYPPEQKRSAVMPLLYVAQRENMSVSEQDMADIAEILDLHATEVASIVGYYSLYYDQPEGKTRIQICTDLPCALRGADKYAADVCENLGVKFGETTPDGKVTVEAVMCLAACDKAPMFQLQDGSGIYYHENQAVDGTLELINKLREAE